jgi:hypothetical protein
MNLNKFARRFLIIFLGVILFAETMTVIGYLIGCILGGRKQDFVTYWLGANAEILKALSFFATIFGGIGIVIFVVVVLVKKYW